MSKFGACRSEWQPALFPSTSHDSNFIALNFLQLHHLHFLRRGRLPAGTVFKMSPVLLWILFFICFFFLMPVLLSPRPVLIFLILIPTATFQDYRYYVDLPTPVFWILLVCLLPCLFEPSSLGFILLYTLVIAHAKMLFPEMPTTWLLSSLFWIYWVLIWPFAGFYVYGQVAPGCLISWFITTIILRDKIHFLMSPGYWIGWPVLFTALHHGFHPDLPLSWDAVCLSLILVSGILIRPDISVVRFDLWTLFIFVGRPIVRALFTWVWCYPETYLFPFNLISGYWKISSKKWYPVSERPDSTGALCGQCKHFTAKSKLILGSNYPLTRLIEMHKTWDSFEQLRDSALKVNQPCHFCNILWHSIGENRRQEIAAAEVRPMVKIWEERPLTRYTFAQLFEGDTAIGDRLLIHREKLFDNCESLL